MKGLVFCNKGIEEISKLEIKGLIGKESTLFEEYLTFDCSKEELCKLTYLMQTINKTVLILKSLKFKNNEDVIKNTQKIDFTEWLDNRTFKVEVRNHDYKELEGDIGKEIIDNIKVKPKVDLDDPDIIVYVFIDNDLVYYGIDFSGADLSKRGYRIYSSPRNIKSTIAYAMLRMSDYKKGEVFLDPLCLSGSIAIEAALYNNNFPVRYFEKDEFLFNKFKDFNFEKIDKNITKDKNNINAFDNHFRNIDASKKNAKIAGINKAIHFSKIDVNWLDTKFKENAVDRLVTCLPTLSKHADRDSVLKLFKEFFHQAEYIVKGSTVVCCRDKEVKDIAKEKGLKLKLEKEVWQGHEGFLLLKFEK